ncbi:MAG: isoprenylcysteine carboxylmethyltransferase family protein [Candidatus Omnitrophota bacterium]|nr:isoprenylcysteine carboxylmethyltransferase family protein [Candidatus Omnitrophota bacterium]MDZ4241890.1 isoprenylcysteine carboxylmethyltransferase family protein [Candidatus Omnitrophota bacterium]
MIERDNDKIRIKIDALVITSTLVVLGFLILKFPRLFLQSEGVSEFLDLFGFFILLLGIFFRMAARGYKKVHSRDSKALVQGGPYAVTRNPMYLGTLLIGSGLMLIGFPFWCLGIFIGAFYLRFRIQVGKEEDYLLEMFGDAYADYFRRVPRFLPRFSTLRSLRIQELFQWKYFWITQEKQCLFYLPVVAVALELIEEGLVSKDLLIWKEGIVFGLDFLILLFLLLLLKERDPLSGPGAPGKG